MHKKLFCSLLLLLIALPYCIAQKSYTDSLLHLIHSTKDKSIQADAYNELFLSFEYTDTAKARTYVNQAYAIAQKNNLPKASTTALLYMGYFEEDKANHSKAIVFYTKALSLSIKNKLTKETAKINNAIGNSYLQQGKYAIALEYYLKTLKSQNTLKNEAGIANCYINIGLVQFYLDNYNESFKYYSLAKDLFQKMGDKTGLGTVYQNLGNLFANKGEFETALKYFDQSLKISTELGNLDKMGNTYSSIGMVMALNGKYDKAQENYAQSLKINEQYGNQSGVAIINCNLGEVFIELRQFEKAKNYLNKSISIAKSIGERVCLKNAYIAKTKLDSLQGNYKDAYLNYRTYIAYRDSLNNEEIRKKTTQSQLEFAFEKKEAIAKAEHKKEIEKERALADESSRKQNLIILFVTIGFVVLMIFVIIITRSLKNTKAQKIIIELQKTVVEEKNKEITDSINYAKRIQSAILPSSKIIHELLPQSFVLYKPKDIVAGDFYWMEKKGETVLFAACDCTGHGVPGAMVSVICNNGLNRSVREHNLTDPGKILDKTREIVIQEFEKSEEEVKDGMDISLLALNGNSLKWSGANNPLWIIRNGEIIEYKANKQPIGKYADPKPFTTHIIDIQKGDSIYFFTDGLQDQFGGEKGKKFKASKLKELLLSIQDKSMQAQKNDIDQEFQKWKGDLEQNDDVCMIGIRI